MAGLRQNLLENTAVRLNLIFLCEDLPGADGGFLAVLADRIPENLLQRVDLVLNETNVNLAHIRHAPVGNTIR